MNFDSIDLAFGRGAPCVIIGEIGVNHNNDVDILMRLIEEGARAGLDVLKLQHFVAEEEISRYAPSADYQAAGGHDEGQLALVKALELSGETLVKAQARCRELGVGFLCSVFDPVSAAFVAEKLGCTSVKIASSEVGAEPFLAELARKFDGLILSTGASELSETARAVETLRAHRTPERRAGDRRDALRVRIPRADARSQSQNHGGPRDRARRSGRLLGPHRGFGGGRRGGRARRSGAGEALHARQVAAGPGP